MYYRINLIQIITCAFSPSVLFFVIFCLQQCHLAFKNTAIVNLTTLQSKLEYYLTRRTKEKHKPSEASKGSGLFWIGVGVVLGAVVDVVVGSAVVVGVGTLVVVAVVAIVATVVVGAFFLG